MYRPDMSDDLQRYFDYYAKGIQNGWKEDTPRVRLSLLGFESGGGAIDTVIERSETSYPLQREMLRTFYLDNSTQKLVSAPPEEQHTAYEAHHLTDSLVGQDEPESPTNCFLTSLGLHSIFHRSD